MISEYLRRRPFLPLVTERLIIRSFEQRDVEALVYLLKDKRIAEMTARIPYPYTVDDAKSWISMARDGLKTGESLRLAIARRHNNALIGGIGLDDELGYWLGTEFWGQGLMTEAVNALLHFAFFTLKVDQISGSAKEVNTASKRIFASAGFRETGVKQSGAVTFELTADEYRTAFNARKRSIVWVVAAALINPEGKLLLASRPPGKKLAGVWELPGGKLELGETPEQALVRELKEELHIDVNQQDLEPLTFASYAYETFHLIMPLYICRKWQGIPHGAEGQKLAWVTYGDLVNYPFPPADIMLTHRVADLIWQ